MTYDDVNHLSARIKPKQQRVKKHQKPSYFVMIVENVCHLLFLSRSRWSWKWRSTQQVRTTVAAKESRSLWTWTARRTTRPAPIQCMSAALIHQLVVTRLILIWAKMVTFASIINKMWFKMAQKHPGITSLRNILIASQTRNKLKYGYYELFGLCINTLLKKCIIMPHFVRCIILLCRKMMDKQTFSSIQATTNTSRYAAAVFRKGLIPLSNFSSALVFWFV